MDNYELRFPVSVPGSQELRSVRQTVQGLEGDSTKARDRLGEMLQNLRAVATAAAGNPYFQAAAIGGGTVGAFTARSIVQTQGIITASAYAGPGRFTTAASLQYLGNLTGQDVSPLAGLSSRGVNIASMARELSAIEDPVKRATVAMNRFGEDALVALPMVNNRLATASEEADKLARTLDTKTRLSIGRLTDDLKAPIDFLDRLKSTWSWLIQNAQLRLTIFLGEKADQLLGTGSDRIANLGRRGLGSIGLGGLAELESFGPYPRTSEGNILIGGPGSTVAADSALRRFSSTFEGLSARYGQVRSTAAGLREQYTAMKVLPEGDPGRIGLDYIAQLMASAVKQEEELRRVFIVAARKEGIRRQVEEMLLTGVGGSSIYVLGDNQDIVPRLEPGFPNQPGATRLTPSLRRPGETILPGGSINTSGTQLFRLPGGGYGSRAQALGGRVPTLLGPNETINPGAFSGRQDVLAQQRAFGTEALQREVAYQSQKIQLMTGPGGEVAAIRQVTQLRLDALEKFKRLGMDDIEVTKQRLEIERSGELQLLELRRQRIFETRDTAGRVFDATLAGGRGLLGLASTIPLQIGRTITQNAAAEIFRGGLGRLTIPGQGTPDNPNLLGRLLQGTVVGLDPLKAATVQNTAVTMANTAAIDRMSTVLVGGGAGGGGGYSSVPGVGTLDLGSIFGGATRNPAIFNNQGGTTPITPSWNPMGSVAASRPGIGTMALGIGGAALGGFLGVRAGVRQGGVQGGLTAAGAASSAIGATLLLLNAVPVVGQIASLVGLGLLGGAGLMGDPKARRDRQLDEMIRNAAFTPSNTPMDLQTGIFGGNVDYDRRGMVRVYQNSVTVAVQAMDSKSFVDNANNITDAVRVAVRNGHALTEELRFGITPQ